ncbi:MAG: sensor histidine kinase, partial [Vallitaleaceae bacterium]|nr:sensor histidine kinase [Vallitaleaceae bacterium]
YEGEKIWGYLKGYIEEYLYIHLEEGDALYSKLAQEADVTRRVSVVLILGSSLFALFIGSVFIQSFINPIKRLAYNSKRMASGDLEVPELMIRSKDEVGILGESFNSMSKSIREYVNELEEKVVIEKKLHEEELELVRMEQLLKEAQFETLQSQINPHFLFNTLNTISRTAMFEKANDTMKLIQALSGLFRYKLRNQSSVISLKEELANAEEYIFLQKYRFKERLQYEIAADEASARVEIPIFFLQPLLENAIIHGIEPKIEGGKIRIKIVSKWMEGKEWVVIRVTDTGVGIKKERLQEILDFHLEGKKSIGVSNVYHRFYLMYGEQGRFRMLSKEGLGTCVEFRMERGSRYEK